MGLTKYKSTILLLASLLFTSTLWAQTTKLGLDSQYSLKNYAFGKQLSKPVFNLAPFNKKIKLTGDITLNAFYTEIQNPRSLNEKQYLRISGNPKLSLFGLPFNGNFYYTTEENRFYNTNTFGISFDKEQLIENLRSQAQNELNAYKSSLSELNRTVQKQEFDLSQIKRQIELEKRRVQFDSILLSKWHEEKLQLDSLELENPKNINTDSIRNIYAAKKDKILYRMHYADSMKKVAELKYEQTKVKIEDLQMQYEEAKKWVKSADSLVDNPLLLIQKAISKRKGLGFVKGLAKIERLDIGNIQPAFGEMMLAGLPARGLDVEVGNRWITRLIAGKTFNDPIAHENRPTGKRKYNRNIVSGGMGYQSEAGESHLNITRIWDHDGIVLESNYLLGALNNYNIRNKIKINTESFISWYKHQSNIIQSTVPAEKRNENNWLDQSAIQIKADYALNNNIHLNAKYLRLGTYLQNIGNPFLRRDFREVRWSVSNNLFKNKVNLTGFYLLTLDNLKKTNSFTNQVKGVGFQVQTSFAKYPNLFLSYSPYNQGTYHSDSLLRTNNQFATKTASITYPLRFRKCRIMMSANYLEGLMQFGDNGNKIFNRNLSFQGNLQSKKLNGTLGYSTSFTDGRIDTLTFKLLNGNIQWKATKTFTIGTQLQYATYANGGKRVYQAAHISYLFKQKCQMQWVLGYQYLERIWGIYLNKGFTGQCVIVFRI